MMGKLKILISPIGSMKDLSYSVLRELEQLDYIYAEDTRVTRKIITSFNIKTKNKLRVLNDVNEGTNSLQIIELLKKGNNIGIISDAGHPVICDPGYKLIKLCYQENIEVAVVGATSAILAAIILSNLEPASFMFGGYLKLHIKNQAINQLKKALKMTTVFFITKHDLDKLDKILSEFFSENNFVVIKEISKINQNIYYGAGKEIIKSIPQEERRGEFVLLVKKQINKQQKLGLSKTARKIIDLLNNDLYKPKQKAKKIAEITKDSVNLIYQYLIKPSNFK